MPPVAPEDRPRTVRISSAAPSTPATAVTPELAELAEPTAVAPRRHVAIPAVLLVAGTLAMAGLAAPTGGDDVVRVTAAAETTSLVDLGATSAKRLDLLDGPQAAAPKPVVKKQPARATRSGSTRTVVKKKPVAVDRFCRPNGGGISSYYGQRWGRMHKGVDFNGSYGSPIRAVAAGRVVSAGYDGGYGKLVTVRHSDGTTTAYAHMSRIAVEGGRVDACEVIGYVGSTGNSTGPHLHFEVRTGGGTVNPLTWLRRQGVRV